jgi:hypothetical protein
MISVARIQVKLAEEDTKLLEFLLSKKDGYWDESLDKLAHNLYHSATQALDIAKEHLEMSKIGMS